MKSTRDRILKIGISLLVLALAFGAGSAVAQTQNNGNTDTDQFPPYVPGSTGSKDQPNGSSPKQIEGPLPSTTDGNTPLEVPGLQYLGTAPDENSGTAETGSAMLSTTFSYYMVSGNNFTGKSSTITYAYDTLGCVHSTNGSGQFTAELHIPNGSVIKYIRIYYIDTNPSSWVSGLLTAYAPGSVTYDLIGVSSTGSSGYGFEVSTELTHTVDTSQYAYNLIFYPTAGDSSVQFCGMRVAYYAPTFAQLFMPLVNK